ncbi:MAG: hypothetical protein DRJ98_04865 [Thermoprotei archaeon]|nr:MAG: hypothetical protein DRJ52_03280 [Thermoprotei archaeon]RLF10959.1 MAG: hypothetical protein DRJ98_04865 [Thermoprotei archaeon]HDI75479.1 hypothetical protein [Thermoprotei archaeon]
MRLKRNSSLEEIPYRDYRKIRLAVIEAMGDLIKKSRGSCVTFTCKKLAIIAGLPSQPVLLTVIRSVLDELCDKGLITRYSKSSHGIKYMATKESPIWMAFKQGDSETLNKIVEL